MRRIRTIAVLPTLFTLGNLVCGFFAIVVAARIDAPGVPVIEGPRVTHVLMADLKDPTNIMYSAWLIFLAMAFDALDGHLARLSRTMSDFGAQLDSLCDLVTFGVAPGFLLVKMCPNFAYLHREAVWVIAAAFAACAALGTLQRRSDRNGRPFALQRPSFTGSSGGHRQFRDSLLYAA